MQFILGHGKSFCLNSLKHEYFYISLKGKIMSRLKYLLFAFILIPINAAQASQINQQGADKLKSYFQELLDYQKTINDALGSVQIEYKGELIVKPESTYYSATFPQILIRAPKVEGVPDDGTVFDMGVIKINAIPDEKEGYWKTIITLPSKMTLKGKTPEEDFSVLFKDQRSIALFSEKIGYFTQLNMSFSGIKFQSANQDVGIDIGGLQIYFKMEDKGDGFFSGPGHLLISDLNIAPPQEKETISAKELKVNFTANKMKMPTLKEYEDRILNFAKTLESMQNKTAEEVKGTDILNTIMDMYEFDLEGFTIKYNIKGFEITSDTNQKSRDFDSIYLGSAFIGLGFQGVKSESGSMSIESGYDTIKISPSDPEYKDIIPQNVNLNIKANKIPYGSLTKIATNTAKAIATDPNSAQMAGIGVLMRLPALLSQAGTEISVENNGVKNKIYNLTLNGKVLTDLSAMTGFTAKFTALFEGLDAILAIAKKNAANKDSKNASNFEQMVTKLEGLKAVGKAQKGANGKPAYAYDIQATPEGKFLVNGQEASTIFTPKQ